MHRLKEIKKRLDKIIVAVESNSMLSNSEQEVKGHIRGLKDYVETEHKKLLKQSRLTEFEENFVKPAIKEVRLQALDKIRRGARCEERVKNHLADTQTTIDWWLAEIESSDSITE